MDLPWSMAADHLIWLCEPNTENSFQGLSKPLAISRYQIIRNFRHLGNRNCWDISYRRLIKIRERFGNDLKSQPNKPEHVGRTLPFPCHHAKLSQRKSDPHLAHRPLWRDSTRTHVLETRVGRLPKMVPLPQFLLLVLRSIQTGSSNTEKLGHQNLECLQVVEWYLVAAVRLGNVRPSVLSSTLATTGRSFGIGNDQPVPRTVAPFDDLGLRFRYSENLGYCDKSAPILSS